MRKNDNMLSNSDIIKFLNNYLNIESIEDDSNNGVQVDSEEEIYKIGFAVDARIDTVNEAVRKNADLLIVHHGIIWGGIDSVKGKNYEIIKKMLENDLGLYAAHLPLDLHPNIGNNAEISNIIGSHNLDTFHEYKGSEIALLSGFEEERPVIEIKSNLENEFGRNVDLVKEGPDKVKKVGILTGSGADAIYEALELEADLFITGERDYTAYNTALDENINLIFGGHYSTETLGVKNLQKIIEDKFNVETFFINRETIY